MHAWPGLTACSIICSPPASVLSRVKKPADHHGSAIAQQHLQQLVRTLRLASARFGRHLRAWEPDCVLSFLPYSNLIALLAQQWYRWPGALVLSDRNYLSRELAGLPWPMLHARFIRAYYGRAARHVCVSNAAAVDLRASFGVASERIVTIANGVDGADLAARAADALPDSAPIRTPEHLWLVAVGRLQAQKGFDILLAALAQPRASRWQLLLLGTGPDETALRTQARQLGLATRIHFLGWDANPYRWLGRADAYVLSSRWEGMPNALLEALALGRPVIATDCQSGPREILDGGCYGRLVPPEAVEPLAEALGDFADDANVRAHYSALALERSQRYCINRMVTEYARLLEQVIGERRGAGELP